MLWGKYIMYCIQFDLRMMLMHNNHSLFYFSEYTMQVCSEMTASYQNRCLLLGLSKCYAAQQLLHGVSYFIAIRA